MHLIKLDPIPCFLIGCSSTGEFQTIPDIWNTRHLSTVWNDSVAVWDGSLIVTYNRQATIHCPASN